MLNNMAQGSNDYNVGQMINNMAQGSNDHNVGHSQPQMSNDHIR